MESHGDKDSGHAVIKPSTLPVALNVFPGWEPLKYVPRRAGWREMGRGDIAVCFFAQERLKLGPLGVYLHFVMAMGTA